jgi:glycosyltransferase involved in cell wall biosynthesis
LDLSNNSISRLLLRVKLALFTAITSASMQYVYKMSDRFMVLSPAFIQNFKDFTGIRNPKKLIVQTNPVTIDTKDSELCVNNKSKEILFVGRLDYVQKRVNRILETWSYIEPSSPEWKLTLLGDGPDKKALVELQKKLNLHNICFEGVQNPMSYYKRSSLLVLASEFEGLPLVLAECMSYGVIPVVYGSFSSVYDIIEDGIDGVIIPKTPEGFNAAVMAEKIKFVLADDETRNRMSLAAIEKSKRYSIDKIYDQWMKVLNDLQGN